ncbi:hypothetical protein RCS94_07830 [Orbaceae bacterium ac157xtp]
MLIAPLSYGALSATSANTIKGRAPTFTGQSGANKLGFKVGNTFYSEGEGNIVGNTEQIFDAGLRLNEFVVQGLSLSDFTVQDDYYDEDGDEADASSAFTIGNVSYEWWDSNGKITDYTKMVGCSGLSHPLTLKIKLSDVQVHSKYGSPKESALSNLIKEYKIGTTSGICFAKPNQMIVQPQYTWAGYISGNSGESWSYNNGSLTPHPKYGGGYDETQFDPENGFRANPVTTNLRFPTTGFPGAQFNLIMTSAATDWIFTSNAEPAVTVDANGTVKLNSKPAGAVTIKAVLKTDSTMVHNYTFNPTNVWIVTYKDGPESGLYSLGGAITKCGGESNLPSRTQLTNSRHKREYSNTANGQSSVNFATRKIGGSLFSEWWTFNQSHFYPYSNSFWTRADLEENFNYAVWSDGWVDHAFYWPTDFALRYAACLK